MVYKNIVDQDLEFPVEKHEALLTYLKTTFAEGGKDFEDVKIALEAYFEEDNTEVHKNKDGTLYVDLDWEDEFDDEDDKIWTLSAFMKDHAYIEYYLEDSNYYRMYVYEGKVYKQYGEIVYPKMKGQ